MLRAALCDTPHVASLLSALWGKYVCVISLSPVYLPCMSYNVDVNFAASARVQSVEGLAPRRERDSREAMHEQWPEPDEARAAFETGLETTLDQFLRAGVRVVVFHQMPQQRAIPGILVQNALLLGLSDAQAADLFAESHVSRADNDALQRLARDAIEQVSQTRDVTVVSFDEAFAVGDAFAWFDGRDALFLDDDHLSSVGALSLQPIVNEVLLQQ